MFIYGRLKPYPTADLLEVRRVWIAHRKCPWGTSYRQNHIQWSKKFFW